jgi:cytochrome c oxidase assembly protein subunit 15
VSVDESTAVTDAGVPGVTGRTLPSWYDRLVRGLCLATLVANGTIVVTGAAVRLTGSGLGCPTWPKCTSDSYVNTAAYGVHGVIEFGNRTLTFALSSIVLATVVAVFVQRPRRGSLCRLALLQLAGIAAQAVLGGITVRTGLNPWTVSGHFLLSTVLIYAAYALWHRAKEGDGLPRPLVTAPLRWVLRAIVLAAALTITIGTVVTGSGPHAGDASAKRTGFDPALIAQLHADSVFLLIGLTVAGLFALWAATAPAALRHGVAALLGVELAQGAVGYVQYFTHLPIVLVGVHILGATVLWVFAVRLVFLTHERLPLSAPRVGTPPVSAPPG